MRYSGTDSPILSEKRNFYPNTLFTYAIPYNSKFQAGGKRRKNADGDLKNGLPCVCFHLTHFDSILKVKLNILCVSHEVNFPWSVRTSGGVGRPYCRRLG